MASSPLSKAEEVTALILAGGRSTRMGSDKALLTWQGIPFIQRVYEEAQRCCQEVCVVTPWPQQYQSLLPKTTHWIMEAHPHEGPLVALSQGLEAVSTPWVLLLACDMPCLDALILQAWIQSLPLQNPATLAYVPFHQSRWEALCGFYHRDVKSSLQTFVWSGGRSFQSWLSTIQAVPLRVDDAIAPMLRNCNTPEDLVIP